MSQLHIRLLRPHVEEILSRYEAAIGKDFLGYRNHVYRTITYAMHFLGDAPECERPVETALAFHDIGLWTARSLAYLDPSEAVALFDNDRFAWGIDSGLLRGAIRWHHKMLPYRGPQERLIEACRKADWIDVSRGILRKGVSKSTIARVQAAFPNAGFHATLFRLAKDYEGTTLAGAWQLTRSVVRW